ncbi:36067_t:CDS:2, partial [Gigaspora margarita]
LLALNDSIFVHNNQIGFCKASDLLLNAFDLTPNKRNNKFDASEDNELKKSNLSKIFVENCII